MYELGTILFHGGDLSTVDLFFLFFLLFCVFLLPIIPLLVWFLLLADKEDKKKVKNSSKVKSKSEDEQTNK